MARKAAPDRETLLSVAQAALKLTSGYDKAELLVPIAKYYLADDGLATAYMTAAASIADDYNCARAIGALLAGNTPLSDKVVEVAMNAAATRMKSDYEKRSVIEATVGNQRALGPESRRSVIAAIATISASYDRRAAISAFVAGRQFNEQDAIGLINATTTISGSYDRAEALIDIATHHGLADAGVRDAYMKAAETIKAGSDYRGHRGIAQAIVVVVCMGRRGELSCSNVCHEGSMPPKIARLVGLGAFGACAASSRCLPMSRF